MEAQHKYPHPHHRRTHGMFGTPTYASWADMIQRCTNPRRRRYADYGARGISVCDRWRKFEHFLADMGTRPEGFELERNNNDGNYEPGNCRWATPTEQSNNRRSSHWLTVAGQTHTISEWARLTGIRASKIFKRLKRGWSPEKALEVSQ